MSLDAFVSGAHLFRFSLVAVRVPYLSLSERALDGWFHLLLSRGEAPLYFSCVSFGLAAYISSWGEPAFLSISEEK